MGARGSVEAGSGSWEREFYKTGYEGFDRLDSFPSARELEAYREHLLRKSQPQVEFLLRNLGSRPLRVIEFCSGNGRLLVALALRQMLGEGLGLEISSSRVAFARQWQQDLGLASLHTAAADVLEYTDFAQAHFDLAICITGAFNYFRPIRDTAPMEVLRKMRAALRPGGHLLLELYTLPERRAQMLALNEGRLRLWQPLPPEDRFAYYLDDFKYFAGQRVLRHEKIFIGRDGTIDAGRVEVLAYYSPMEVSQDFLVPLGFQDIQVFGDFGGGDYRADESASYVVLGTAGKLPAASALGLEETVGPGR